MKIVVISMVRNEADIIEIFVRYHLQMVDQMIVVDHRSIDSTAKILFRMKEEFLNLEVVREDALDYRQSQVMTEAMRRAVQEYSADWIIPLDADEFLTPSREDNVRDILALFPEDRVVQVPWRTYVPASTDDPKESNILRRIRHHRLSESPQVFKVLIPRLIASRNTEISQGSHRVCRKTFWGLKKRALSCQKTDRLVLAHFPVRSPEQIMGKVMGGWLLTLSKPNRKSNEVLHWKDLYDRFKEGCFPQPDDLTSIALAYATKTNGVSIPLEMVESPVKSGHEIRLRYKMEQEINPHRFLAETAEELAYALAEARRKIR